MSVPMFLAERPLLADDHVVLAGPEGRHAATVRRLRPGERVDLTDGAGFVAECVVTRGGRDLLELDVRARREEPPPTPRLVVVQALAKGDRAEGAVEAMTEVGVDVIVPWSASRCVAQWRGERGAKALARWRSTAREAAKQSRRPWLPEVTELTSTEAVARLLADAESAAVLAEGSSTPFASLSLPRHGSVVVVVGPEGGISEAELRTFESVGAKTARLGPTVLRTSTAGVAAAAVALARCGRW
ncbi:MAG: 16S rRNA (uracil(1498)-N(3))-methyltransferase [Streptosporangiales bacterium]|nr:16S rRNA (uracil(1498)-N(3))-methyltransferase [Streptosporangiales bacterium]